MEWILELYEDLKNFLYALIQSIIGIFKDLFYWLFDLIMGVIDSILGGIISLFEPVDISQYLTGFPSEVAWVFGQLGLPQAFGMIGTAIAARLLLQLVPFTRLGS